MDNNDCRWPVAIGTTESGEGRVFDYSKASNILVAGDPKQGKSTAIGVLVDALKSYPEAYGMQFRASTITPIAVLLPCFGAPATRMFEAFE